VAAIQRFRDAGYSPKQILDEHPDLTLEDVEAALAFEVRGLTNQPPTLRFFLDQNGADPVVRMLGMRL
jgi:hypothetical protein